ncbi:MAG: Dam family site-specific DNA-(adenine-N6)-methyltransferase [Lachnospiraceae bacterium]|nr:Dam family site-specific DNA-(adenine-N6)-methyltransferase [Lachnospiraceae bacterium]
MRFIGGKSQLLTHIDTVIRENSSGSERVFCDIFAGTGSVARYFKPRYEIHTNDILHFSYVLQKATIEYNQKPSFHGLAGIDIYNPLRFLEEVRTDIDEQNYTDLFITQNYSPNDKCKRMYLSHKNALRIDFIRNTVEAWKQSKLISDNEYYYLLAALIEGVPYVSNITGTYGAYLKEWDKRALKDFEMVRLEIYDNTQKNKCYNMDANKLIRELEGDILYLDPPYNGRQYVPNYHLLETISRYDSPPIKGITGVRPYDDEKSAYCSKSDVLDVFEDLIDKANFKSIILSYNNNGLMTAAQIEDILKKHGIKSSYKRYDIPYRKYKSKIVKGDHDLQEYLFYIRKRKSRSVTFTIKANHSVTRERKTRKYLKSPLNYIGGKYRLLPQILPLFPQVDGTFIDLFAGGCNVGINIIADAVVCNDINTKIVEMYQVFQKTDTQAIITQIEDSITRFNLSKDNESGFTDFRNYYNLTQNPIDLYTLSCYSFNYQFRFNNNHEYNNPFGRNRSHFSENMRTNLLLFLERIKKMNIEFSAFEFTQIDLNALTHNDMVYCDPPYLITTGSYNDGNRGFKDWKEEQEISLYRLLDELHDKGIRFALSNVLTHKDRTNEILSEWAKKYDVTILDFGYNNSSYNTTRGGSTEVLVTNF